MMPRRWTTRADLEHSCGLAVVAVTLIILAVFALLVTGWWRP